MSKQHIIRYNGKNGYLSQVIESEDFIPVRAADAGFFESFVKPVMKSKKGKFLHGSMIHILARCAAHFALRYMGQSLLSTMRQ